MIEFNESRHVRIHDRIIKLENLHALATIIDAEFRIANDPKAHTSVSYSAVCQDDSSYESEDPRLFSPESFLKNKQIESIEMKYFNYETRAGITINIYGETYRTSSIDVKGKDTTWVNGVTARLEQIMNTFTPQNNFLKRHNLLLTIISSLSLGYLITRLIILVPSVPPSDAPAWANSLNSLLDRNPLFRPGFLFFLQGLLGYFPALYLIYKTSRLWPSIEFQIGPDHLLFVRNRRKRTMAFFLIAGIPLLINIGSGIIMAWMK